MIIIFLPILVYVCSLVASYILAVFLRRYLWKLCLNKIVAFSIGAVVFLIASKLFSILASLILSIVFRSLGPEAGQLLGILAFSYGDKLIYFVTITPAVLACIVGYKYLSANVIYSSKIPQTEVATTKSRLFLRLTTSVSVLIFLFALFGSWGPLYGAVTVPVMTNAPRVLASSLHQPRLCLLMPIESFDSEYNYGAEGIKCLHDSQTEEEFYANCNLIPLAFRDSEPYQECVIHQAKSLAQNSSSLPFEIQANICNGITDLEKRFVCLLPYRDSSVWGATCNEVLNSMRQNKENNWEDAIIIGKCLDNKTVNELDQNGMPLWFNWHVITGYEKDGIPLTRDNILQWLRSLEVNPNIIANPSATLNAGKSIDTLRFRDEKGKTFLSHVLDASPGSDIGKIISADNIHVLLTFGIDPHIKDAGGLSAMDYAFEYGYLGAVQEMLPSFKGYKPSADLVTSFLTHCHTDYERGTEQEECYGSFGEGEHYEEARQGYLRLGLLSINLNTIVKKFTTDTPIVTQWKTYRDEKYGFEVSLPIDASVSEIKNQICTPNDIPMSFVEINYSNGYIEVGAYNSKFHCESGKYGTDVQSNSTEVMLGNKAFTANGYAHQDKNLNVSEYYQFNPDTRTSIGFGVSMYDYGTDNKISVGEYSMIKDAILKILQTYKKI